MNGPFRAGGWEWGSPRSRTVGPSWRNAPVGVEHRPPARWDGARGNPGGGREGPFPEDAHLSFQPPFSWARVSERDMRTAPRYQAPAPGALSSSVLNPIVRRSKMRSGDRFAGAGKPIRLRARDPLRWTMTMDRDAILQRLSGRTLRRTCSMSRQWRLYLADMIRGRGGGRSHALAGASGWYLERASSSIQARRASERIRDG